jgi:hypothetical protein
MAECEIVVLQIWARTEVFSFSNSLSVGFGVHLTSYPMGTIDLYPIRGSEADQ